MKVGDLVQIIGSLSAGPEVTSTIGVIMEQWKIDEWWVVMTPRHGLVNWPESQMIKVDDEA